MLKNFRSILGLWLAIFCVASFGQHSLSTTQSGGFDLEAIERMLKGDGLRGLIHGAVHEQGLYVVTYRQQGQLLGIEFPLTSQDDAIKAKFRTLRRNDRVLVKGQFIQNQAPQKHIRVTHLDVTEPFNPGQEPPVVRPDVSIPADLMNKTSFIGKVHAAVDNGRILVVDYRGAIIPVFVSEPKLSNGLWPNDKIKIEYTIRTQPPRPTHIALNVTAAKPIDVLNYMSKESGKVATLRGVLVRFPRSVLTTVPDVFAVETTDEDQVKQYYFIHSLDQTVLAATNAAVRKIWNSEEEGRVTYRSRYINPNLRIQVTGTIFSSELAGNPQILVDSADQVTVPEKP